MDDNGSARIEELVEGLKEIREISSLKRLEASVTDDLAGRLRVAGQALERIDVIVKRLLAPGGYGDGDGGQTQVRHRSDAGLTPPRPGSDPGPTQV